MPKYSTLPNPDGWFAVCFSHELSQGEVQARKLFERDVVLFRTETGEAAMLDAHCPHMGAHLGVGGRVEGESIRCPFHGFEFDASGRCVATPYQTKIPPKCNTRAWPVCERNGVVLAWHHHAGAPPSFEIPTYDLEGWLPLATQTWTISSHPQETSENSVDLGHLAEVHGYREVRTLDEIRTEGAYLSTRYAMARSGFGFDRAALNQVEFHVHVHGLGFSHVEAHEKRRDLDIRFWVLCTPTIDDKCELRTACTVKPPRSLAKVALPLRLAPRTLTARLIQHFAFREFCGDVAQDFEIWANKIYVDPPLLAKGDGPVGRYRKWCRQFYARLPQAVSA